MSVRERMKKLDPRVVTGGAPIFPLVVLFGLNAVDELDRTAFGVLTPEIKDAFGLSLTGIATLTAVILPVGLLVELPVAYFADRWNRTRMAAAGAFIWAFFTVLTGVAGLMLSLPALYIARGGSALGKTFNATHNSLLADYYAQDVRAPVFYAHRLANSLGQFIGPLIAGLLAAVFFWELPFFLFAIPTLIFVVLALKLKEPTRGFHERVAAGADAETAEIEEVAAGFSETFRVLFQRESARRIYYALPFISASALGIGTFMSLFYDEVYHVGSGGRGVIFAMTEPAQVVGLLVGAVVMRKIVATDPGRAMKLLGYSAIISAICLAVVALSPMIGFAIAAQLVNAFVSSILTPGVLAVISLAVPARMRTLAFATGSLWFLMGAPVLLLAGAIGDRFGLRVGILLFIPVYLIGSFLLASAGKYLGKDIERLNLSARTQAEIRKRRMDGDPQILVVRGLCVGYDQTQVLFDVDLEIADGEIVALLGTNGSGKSSLLRSISGLNPSNGGAVIFDGRDISGSDPQTIASLGLTQVPGERSIFPSLTVEENLRIAGWMYRDDQAHIDASLEKVLGYFPVLQDRWETLAGDLSGGEQQMLSLGQAFIAKPKLLMIDELSLGLAPTVVRQLVKILPAIHANGTAILLVEQSVNTALELAHRAVFLEKGEVRFAGSTAELMGRDDIVRSVYFAAATTENGQKTNGHVPRPIGDAVLTATDLVKRYGGITAVDRVSFELRQNEILGLIGPNGAGKTTIFDLVSGFQAIDGGQVQLFGHDITGRTAHDRARAGLGRSFQNARLWPSLTVFEALATSLERHIEVRAALPAFFHLPVVADSEAAVRKRVEELLELFELGAFRDKFISELSTGVRRIVEFAVQLGARPKVLLLDEPSSGIAQRETDALVPALRRVQDELECSILLIEHDMALIRKLSDRVLALDAGRVVAEGTADEVLSDPRVMESYLGTTAPIEV
jgi:ABC-type branched-subunit amino acid transport system ATPase component/MFS family permease